MSIELKRNFTIPATVDRVARALCSEAYSIEGAEMREEVVSATHRVISEDEGRVEYEVAYVEYARTKTGGINRGETVSSRTRSVLDRQTWTLSWTYTTEASERFRLDGLYRLTPQGEATHVDYRVTIDVRVPLIGNRIAKMVAKGYEESLPTLQARLTKHATAMGTGS
jgi:hypothetical protein